MKIINNNYKKTSEQFVDVLLNNYHMFMNIGKYVDRIDKNISSVMNAQKTYSILLQKYLFLHKKFINFAENLKEEGS